MAEAVKLIGLPDYPRLDGHIEVLPAVGSALEPAPFPAQAPKPELEAADPMIERIDQRQQFDRTRGVGAEVHRLEDRRGSSL